LHFAKQWIVRIQGFFMGRSLVALYLRNSASAQFSLTDLLLRDFDTVDVIEVDTLPSFQHVSGGGFDIFLADYNVVWGTGVDAWNLLEHGDNPAPFVILSWDEMDEAASVDVMRSGVSECVSKENFHRLGYVLQKLLEVWEARNAKILADAALVVSRNQLLRLTQQLHTRIEEERTAVSREIHDDIGGALAAVKFDLAWIARRTTDVDVKDRVQQATSTLQLALEASQRIMLNLRPAILDEGLVPALQWLVDTFLKRTQVEVVFRCGKEMMNLPAEVQTVAFSVVREALTNVVKHACADRVLVDVSDQEGILTIEVTDNGRGLAHNALHKEASFGLLGLRERAQSVGGWLDVSDQSPGVSVTLSVPLSGRIQNKPFEEAEWSM
jgi:two-component system sensor histidine kinase UhpB